MKKATLFLLAGATALNACKSAETKMKIEGSDVKVKGNPAMVTEVKTKEIPEPLKQRLDYPETKKGDQTDEYFGTNVTDPYRWLEDQYSQETAQWVEAQNKVTFGYLAQIPFRDRIKERLTQLWNYEKLSAPFKKGNNFYFFKNDGLQNQAVLYKKTGLNGQEEVFLDPNKLSADGTTSLSGFKFSKNNKYMAYGTSGGGSDWNTWYVMDVATKKPLADKLEWIKFSSAAWQGDGFYYSRYDAPKDKALSNKNEFHKIYFHKIGTPQSTDKLIYENKEKPLLNFSAQTTEDERFLLIYGSEGTSGGTLAYKDLKDPKGKINWLVTTYESEYNVIDNVGDKLLVHTNKNAPNYKVVLLDPKKPAESNWKTVIPESQNVMTGVTMVGGKIMATFLKDAASQVIVYDVNGKKQNELEFPAIGTVAGFAGDKDDKETFYTFTSFTYPTTVYRYDIANNKSELYWQPKLDINPEAYETKQVFYTSKDGTKVPMFIVHKKGLKMDGQNPTYLYAYGGFNISLTPSFSAVNLLWLENGGVYAMPNLRGGGEYGEKWHKGGMTPNKQNVFDDFIAAGEYLKKEGYTSTEKLAISGRSNGGLLVGATMIQKPDLAKVAFPGVGVLDMLRFHKFTIGWAWVPEYGSSDDKAQFENLYKFSPLHNIKAGVAYPATMVTTADHDDRVVPSHSFKFISELQAKGGGTNPYLIRVDVKAGHGAGKPTSLQIQEWADIWSFAYYNMGVDPYAGK
ncbi:S9 family peptidase [Adhaeribacter sp. BT258]|uniref:prolyl oligopeptidase n=1 Tax=Adhaeribacter terrigena TaxID=2793070 RepID=A0ABS1C6E3_9BACT|nr:prolyl oligopeptidase family serine peptidase [Adhaeribacter terrigena]MBK0404253.1 S9 family peptidase [Adhaeribacter terrigena]